MGEELSGYSERETEGSGVLVERESEGIEWGKNEEEGELDLLAVF